MFTPATLSSPTVLHGLRARWAGSFLAKRVLEEAHRKTGKPISYEDITVLERGPWGSIVGGAKAYVDEGYAYVGWLWVRQDCRGRGLGTRIMKKIEDEALRHNARTVWLTTMSYEAPGFYARNGYTEFTQFEGGPNGHARIGFRKKLSPAVASQNLSEGKC